MLFEFVCGDIYRVIITIIVGNSDKSNHSFIYSGFYKGLQREILLHVAVYSIVGFGYQIGEIFYITAVKMVSLLSSNAALSIALRLQPKGTHPSVILHWQFLEMQLYP